MEIQLLDKEKDSIKIQIKDADMTLISPLVKELLEDELVTEVKYTAAHPELGFPTLYVKVSSGKPQTALKRAAKALSNNFKEAKEKLAKELK
ncbi:MAG: RpoL/Rpb11 RNA polymerase subunit family protein [Methanomassiliicoccales archaeon]